MLQSSHATSRPEVPSREPTEIIFLFSDGRSRLERFALTSLYQFSPGMFSPSFLHSGSTFSRMQTPPGGKWPQRRSVVVAHICVQLPYYGLVTIPEKVAYGTQI